MIFFEWFRKKKQQEAVFASSKHKTNEIEIKAKNVDAEEKEKKIVSADKVEVKPGIKTTEAYRIIINPVVSEKATSYESRGVYTFFVARNATKTQVKQAVKELFDIFPRQVRLINVQGKTVRFGRTRGRRKDRKKAIITLPKGATINIHEAV